MVTRVVLSAVEWPPTNVAHTPQSTTHPRGVQRCCKGVQHMPEEYNTAAEAYIQHCKGVQHTPQRSTYNTAAKEYNTATEEYNTVAYSSSKPTQILRRSKTLLTLLLHLAKLLWQRIHVPHIQFYLIQSMNCMKTISACHSLLLA